MTLFIAEMDNTTTDVGVVNNSSGLPSVPKSGSWQKDGQLAGFVIGILLFVLVLSSFVSFCWYLKNHWQVTDDEACTALSEHLVLSTVISSITFKIYVNNQFIFSS
jgi:hypothetical protein